LHASFNALLLLVLLLSPSVEEISLCEYFNFRIKKERDPLERSKNEEEEKIETSSNLTTRFLFLFFEITSKNALKEMDQKAGTTMTTMDAARVVGSETARSDEMKKSFEDEQIGGAATTTTVVPLSSSSPPRKSGGGVTAAATTGSKIIRRREENIMPKNASDSDLTATTFETNATSASINAKDSSSPVHDPSKPNKPSLLNPNIANDEDNEDEKDAAAGRESGKQQPAVTTTTTTATTATVPAKKQENTSPSRRESGRIKSLHVQRATLDAEAKARALKFTCSLFPRANIRVKYLGMVDEKIAEKMDVEKLAKEHYKEGGGNAHQSTSNSNNNNNNTTSSSGEEKKNEMLKPLGYRCEGTLFSEPFEATIDENGYHYVRWGAEGEGRRVVETPCSTSASAEETLEKPEPSNNDSSDTTTATKATGNKKGLLDVDEAVKCIVEEIARRFENKIPGMKPSSSSSLKLNTGNSNNNNNNANGGRLCSNCGAGSNSTPLMRRGPDGVRSLCNACGLWYARRGTQRPVEGGSVAEREAKAAKESMSAAAAAAGEDQLNKKTKEEEEEAKRQREKEIEEKEKMTRIVPKIESLNGYAVFGYHEHIVQDALRAHIIAKYAPSLGIDVLMAAGMQKYGRYESSLLLLNGGKHQPTQQRRSSKRERKEITKFVDVEYKNAPQKRKTNASSKAAAKKLKAQQASEEKAAKKAAAAAAGGVAVTKKAGMRKNASDRSMADQFFGLSDTFHEPPISSNHKNVQQQQHRQPTAAEDLQSWENVLFNSGFGAEPLYTNIIPGSQHRQDQHQSNTMYISHQQQQQQQQQQLMGGSSGELRGFSPPDNINNISNANIINNNVPTPGNFRLDDDLLGLDALMDNHESFIDGNMF